MSEALTDDARSDPADGASGWRARFPGSTASGRLALLFGLAGLAITQPVLDLFGGNPEFFVASNLEGSRIVILALIVVLVPTLLAWSVTALVSRVSEGAGALEFAAGVFGFSGVFMMSLVRAAGIDHTKPFLALVLLGGGAILYLLFRYEPIRIFFRYLAIGHLAFLALFLFASRSSELIWSAGGEEIEAVRLEDSETPVVWLVLDEFPLSTILLPDGSINAERFPELAELSERSTWFRNAASPASLTTNAVPALLTGNVPENGQLPTFDNNPRNAFTLLGTELPVERYEIVTDLCPEQMCTPRGDGSIRTALVDFGVVLGHRKLPAAVRSRLPAIDDGWGGFVGVEESPDVDLSPEPLPIGGDSTSSGSDSDEPDPYEKWNSLGPEVRGPRGQIAALTELTAAIDGDPAFTFIHVAVPHAAWVATPYGDDVMNSVMVRHRITEADHPRFDFSFRQMLQIHALQVAAVDRKIGELVDQLERSGSFDDTLFVISSDHGASLLPPSFGRGVTAETADAVLRVPLFIKLPGQSTGEIDDRPASTLDVLPSIADVLGADIDWEFDGHSLYDGSEPHTERRLDAVTGADPTSLRGLYEVVERTAEFFGDSSLDGLAQVGEFGHLVGTDVADHEIGEPSDNMWVFDQRSETDDLPNEDGSMPFVLTGVVDDEPEADFLIAVNGRIVGVASGFVPHSGDRTRWGAYVANAYRSGANEVEAYEVEESGDAVVLHRIPPTGG